MEREDIRIRVAGIYIENGKILLVKHRKNNREYYLLPGGGQHTGESARDALIREWKEELGLDIIPGQFLFMGESIPPDINGRKHVMQIVFSVLKISGKPQLNADDTLIGQAWIDTGELHKHTLFPLCMDQIMDFMSNARPAAYHLYEWGQGD